MQKEHREKFLAEPSIAGESTPEWKEWLESNNIREISKPLGMFLLEDVRSTKMLQFFAGLSVCCPDAEIETQKLALLTLKFIRMIAPAQVKGISNKHKLPYLPRLQPTDRVNNTTMKERYGYKRNVDILVVGDGNLTFGRALARNLGHFSGGLKEKARSASRLWVSCYETPFQFLRMYKDGSSQIHDILQRGGRVLLGIDATDIKREFQKRIAENSNKNPFRVEAADMKFDKIVFNFPHHLSGGLKGTKMHESLLSKFFRSALEMLKPNGQIVITLHVSLAKLADETGLRRKIDQWNLWGLPSLLDQAGLKCVKSVEYQKSFFHGYKSTTVNGSPFDYHKARSHFLQRM